MNQKIFERIRVLATRIKRHPAFWRDTSDLRYQLADGLLESLPSIKIRNAMDVVYLERMVLHLEETLEDLGAEGVTRYPAPISA